MALAQKDPWADVIDFDAPKQAAQTAPAPDPTQAPPAEPIAAARAGLTTIYKVTLGDGRQVELHAPSNASEQQLHEMLTKQLGQGDMMGLDSPSADGAKFERGVSYDQRQLDDYGEKAIAGDKAKTPDGYALKFSGDHGDKTGFQYTPEQTAEMGAAYDSGDIGQVVALADKYGAPHGVTLDRANVEAAKNAGAPWSLSYGQVDTSAAQNADAEKYRGYDQMSQDQVRKNDILPETLDAGARGAALGADPYIDAVVSSLIHGGTVEDNLARAKAIQKFDEENHPVARFAGSIASSLLLPTKVGAFAREAAGAARADAAAAGLSEAGQLAAARSAASQAMARQLLKEGTGYGAAEGAVNSDGGIIDRLKGAAGGGALGAITAKILPKVGAAISAVREGRVASDAEQAALTPQQEVYAAAQRQGIEPFAADVGGEGAQRITAGAMQAPFAASPIVAAAKRASNTTRDARDRIAAAVGNALTPETAGGEVADAARTQFRNDKSAASNIYNMAEKAAGDTRVTPAKALEVLDRNLAELKEIPGSNPGSSTLSTIREDLARGDHSIAGIRGMRTNLRDQFMRDGLIGSDMERRVNQVVDAAQQDVIDSLATNGKAQAAGLYAKGNEAWRELRLREKQVLNPIIGKEDDAKSGEAVVGTIMRDMQGNQARAVRTLNSLPEDSQNNLRATIISRLGVPGPGKRDAVNDGFSLAEFLTHWNQIGDTARKAYFGPETRAALDDLARYAGASKAAQKYMNHSNTAGASAVLKVATYLTALPQYAAGRMVASPRFARWLARMPRTQLSVPAYVDRLSRIARAEPAIANDVLALQDRLHSAFANGGPARAAANEPGNESSGVGQDQQNQEYNDLIDFSANPQ